MDELHRALEETVYLVIRRHDEAVCIDRIEGLHIRAMALQLGGSLPLHLGRPAGLAGLPTPGVLGRVLFQGHLEGGDPPTRPARPP